MSTNKKLLAKSIKLFSVTLFLMFTGPTILYQAFRNQEHPFYLPVLIAGIIFSIGAIALGFYSLRVLLTVLFGKK